MKRISLLFILLLVVLIGCNSKTIVNEDFSDENYANFSDVKNIIYYLGLDKDSVTILSQDEKQLIFCFTVNDNLDIHDKSILSYASYARNLEEEGYQLTVLDATISSTIVLKNSDYSIAITNISDIEEYKKVHNDISNINKIINENILYELTKSE